MKEEYCRGVGMTFGSHCYRRLIALSSFWLSFLKLDTISFPSHASIKIFWRPIIDTRRRTRDLRGSFCWTFVVISALRIYYISTLGWVNISDPLQRWCSPISGRAPVLERACWFSVLQEPRESCLKHISQMATENRHRRSLRSSASCRRKASIALFPMITSTQSV